ncbi:MAG: TIGR03084 family metal-binding protein [Actinomycetota bacterium]|nr:TIGR03084 family metal-binding protein [Actinomycetota bacterium]
MDQICDDLDAETAALTVVVGDLTEEQWRAPTVAEGWDSHETILHLGAADRFAHLTLTDPASFAVEHGRLSSGGVSLNELVGPDVPALSGSDLWQWFLDVRSKMVDALRQRGPKDRIAWIGPDIGARSMATGRLMETWTHSHDLADTFGLDYPQTDRLRNIAHLGVVTRDFSYVNQSRTPPTEPFRVELTGPNGDIWAWGAEDAANRVTGTAYEFCKVLTRRQPLARSAVHTEGSHATQWMEIAQPWIEPPRISDRA